MKPQPPTLRPEPLEQIAGLILASREHRAAGRMDDADRLKAKADELALVELRDRTRLHHDDTPQNVRQEIDRVTACLASIRQALDGKIAKPKPSKQRQVLTVANDSCRDHGRMPSPTELKAAGIRAQDVADVVKELESRSTLVFHREKRGKKPKPLN